MVRRSELVTEMLTAVTAEPASSPINKHLHRPSLIPRPPAALVLPKLAKGTIRSPHRSNSRLYSPFSPKSRDICVSLRNCIESPQRSLRANCSALATSRSYQNSNPRLPATSTRLPSPFKKAPPRLVAHRSSSFIDRHSLSHRSSSAAGSPKTKRVLSPLHTAPTRPVSPSCSFPPQHKSHHQRVSSQEVEFSLPLLLPLPLPPLPPTREHSSEILPCAPSPPYEKGSKPQTHSAVPESLYELKARTAKRSLSIVVPDRHAPPSADNVAQLIGIIPADSPELVQWAPARQARHQAPHHAPQDIRQQVAEQAPQQTQEEASQDALHQARQKSTHQTTDEAANQTPDKAKDRAQEQAPHRALHQASEQLSQRQRAGKHSPPVLSPQATHACSSAAAAAAPGGPRPLRRTPRDHAAADASLPTRRSARAATNAATTTVATAASTKTTTATTTTPATTPAASAPVSLSAPLQRRENARSSTSERARSTLAVLRIDLDQANCVEKLSQAVDSGINLLKEIRDLAARLRDARERESRAGGEKEGGSCNHEKGMGGRDDQELVQGGPESEFYGKVYGESGGGSSGGLCGNSRGAFSEKLQGGLDGDGDDFASLVAPLSAAAVWNELLQGKRNASAGARTAARVIRTPRAGSVRIELASCASQLTIEGMRSRARGLRNLLRLSLCDDADLDLAMQVLYESQSFLSKLEERASHGAASPRTLWRVLSQDDQQLTLGKVSESWDN